LKKARPPEGRASSRRKGVLREASPLAASFGKLHLWRFPKVGNKFGFLRKYATAKDYLRSYSRRTFPASRRKRRTPFPKEANFFQKAQEDALPEGREEARRKRINEGYPRSPFKSSS